MEPITMLAALGPLAVDLGKSLINRFITPDTFKPSSVAEWLQMRASDVEMFKTMNEAGGSNPSYPWVEAIVRLQRPIVVAGTFTLWVYCTAYGVESATVDNFAASVGFYLFGDRTLLATKRHIALGSAKQ